MRGDGRIFQRGPVFWVAFYFRGKEIRESSRSADEKIARKFLILRRKETGADQLGLKAFIPNDKVTVGELLDALVDNYRIRGKDNGSFPSHLKMIREAFGDFKARDITSARIERFISSALAEGYARETVSRRVRILGQALKNAVKNRQISSAPAFTCPTGGVVRQGFFEPGDIKALIPCLPEYLRDYVSFAYLSAWRKGEIGALSWGDYDQSEQTIRLPGERSKNNQPRRIALEGELLEIIRRRWTARKIETSAGGRLADLIFHYQGRPIKNIRPPWLIACKKAGLAGKLFHDLRRSGVRNMIRSGVSESVAMKISGHKTASIFKRYDITSVQDIRDAVIRTQEYLKTQPTTSNIIPMTKEAAGAVQDDHQDDHP